MTTCDSLPPGSRLHKQENVRFNSRLFKAKIYLKRNHWLLDLFDVVAKFSKPIISLMTLLPKISGKGRGLRKKSWNKRNFAILEVINCCVASDLNAIELTCHGVRPKYLNTFLWRNITIKNLYRYQINTGHQLYHENQCRPAKDKNSY